MTNWQILKVLDWSGAYNCFILYHTVSNNVALADLRLVRASWDVICSKWWWWPRMLIQWDLCIKSASRNIEKKMTNYGNCYWWFVTRLRLFSQICVNDHQHLLETDYISDYLTFGMPVEIIGEKYDKTVVSMWTFPGATKKCINHSWCIQDIKAWFHSSLFVETIHWNQVNIPTWHNQEC